ncbi:MAG: hypothetical protein J6X18_07400 [Bacteroidales bacterium]|nr:hypothetical protein [Bacteroidales bacterium]
MKGKEILNFEPTVELGTKVYTCDSGGIKEWIVFEIQLVRSPYRDEYGNVYYPSNNENASPSLREVYYLMSFDNKRDLTISVEGIFLTPEEAAKEYQDFLLEAFKNKGND